MTEVDLVPGHGQPLASAGLTVRPPLTLAEVHMLLLWQVTARAEELLTAVANGRPPAAELAALAGYARAEVLRQVSDEEALLFRAAPAREVAGLARDHARLRSAAELLARAAAGEQPMSPGQIAIAARDFVVQLERHLQAEENLLASGRAAQQGVPGTAAFGALRHEWYPLTEGPVVELDALPQDQVVAAAVDRLLRMSRGEQVELPVRLGPGAGMAGDQRAHPRGLPVHRLAGRTTPVAHADHPSPGGQLTRKPQRAFSARAAGGANDEARVNESDQLPRQELFMAIATREAQTT
jgi:hemerythrin HHE cation binding domain-containing protein